MPHQERLTVKHSLFAAGSLLSLAIVLSTNNAQSDGINSPYSNSSTEPVPFSNPNSTSNPNTSTANSYPGVDIYRSNQSAAVRATPTPSPTSTFGQASSMNNTNTGTNTGSNTGTNTGTNSAPNIGINTGTNAVPPTGIIQNPAPGRNPNTPNSLQTRPNAPSQPAGTVQ